MKKEYASIKFDYNNMMSTYVGAKEGISDKELASTKNLAVQAHTFFKLNRGSIN